MESLHAYENQLDKELSKIPQLRQLETASGVKKTHMAAGVAATAALFIFFNIAGQLITNVIGFAYPAYQSFKAIESSHKEDDTQWLTYWTVFGVFSILETVVDAIIYWFPFYYIIKVAFLLYLYLPQFNGAQHLYLTAIRPRFLAHQNSLDHLVDSVKGKVNAAAETLKDE